MTDLPLTKLGETASTITLGWTPPSGAAGYVFYADAKRSSTYDGTRSTVKFAKGATKYRVQALAVTAEGAYPSAVVPPAGVLELSGEFTPAAFTTAIAAAPAGPLTVRPSAGASVIVKGSYAPGRKFLTLDGIVFDGQAVTANCWLTDRTDWTYRRCTFRGYYVAGDPASHSEALYVGGGCSDGLIDSCTFDDNGTTGHIFFTWFGGSGGTGGYDTNNYPRRICVKSSTFTRSHNAPYYDIQARAEIPLDCGINIDPSCTLEYGVTPSAFLRAC